MSGGLGDAIGALLIKVKPDGSTFGKDLEGIVGPAGAKVGGAVQSASKVGLGAALAVGGGLLKLGTDLDDAYDHIRTNTGATGDALKGLEGSFSNVAKNVPADLDAVGAAITGVSQKLDLTGKPLEDLSTQFLNLAHITDTDVTGAVESAAAVFQQFNVAVGEQSKTLDQFFQASQASGVSVTDLFDAVNKSGALFAQFGLSVTDSANLVGLLAKNGLTAKDATLGLTKVLQVAGKAGVPAADALKFLTANILGAKDAAAAAAIGIEAFGPKAGPKLAAQIRDGTLSLTDLSGALGVGSDSINKVATDTADASETFKKLKNNLAITLGPAANQLFNSFGQAATNAAPALLTLVKALTPLLVAVTSLPSPVLAAGLGALAFGASLGKIIGPIASVGKAVTGLTSLLAANPYIILIAAGVALVILIVKNWDTIKEVVGNALTAIGGFLSSAFEAYKALVTTQLNIILSVFSAVWTGITTATSVAFEAVRSAVSTAMEAVGAVVQFQLDLITGIFTAVWTTITGAVSAAVGAIGSAISTGLSAAGAVFTFFKDTATTALDGVKSVVGGVADFIVAIPTRIASGFSTLAELITAPFRIAFRAIATLWNGSVGKLSFKFPAWIPGLGGEGFDVPDIPAFAKGGRMTAGLTGLVGEKGPELFTAAQTGQVTSTEQLARLLGSTGQGGGAEATVINHTGPMVELSGPVTVRDDSDIVALSREFARESARGYRAAGVQTS